MCVPGMTLVHLRVDVGLVPSRWSKICSGRSSSTNSSKHALMDLALCSEHSRVESGRSHKVESIELSKMSCSDTAFRFQGSYPIYYLRPKWKKGVRQPLFFGSKLASKQPASASPVMHDGAIGSGALSPGMTPSDSTSCFAARVMTHSCPGGKQSGIFQPHPSAAWSAILEAPVSFRYEEQRSMSQIRRNVPYISRHMCRDKKVFAQSFSVQIFTYLLEQILTARGENNSLNLLGKVSSVIRMLNGACPLKPSFW